MYNKKNEMETNKVGSLRKTGLCCTALNPEVTQCLSCKIPLYSLTLFGFVVDKLATIKHSRLVWDMPLAEGSIFVLIDVLVLL